MDSRAEQRGWRERFKDTFPFLIGILEKVPLNTTAVNIYVSLEDFIAEEIAAERERVMRVVEGEIAAHPFIQGWKNLINLIRAKL